MTTQQTATARLNARIAALMDYGIIRATHASECAAIRAAGSTDYTAADNRFCAALDANEKERGEAYQEYIDTVYPPAFYESLARAEALYRLAPRIRSGERAAARLAVQ